METITCFNKYTEATLAAIELVIQRYSDEPWFNGLLRKLMTEMYLKLCSETFHPPLIFYHHYEKGKGLVISKYSGYHYLIREMERFHTLKTFNPIGWIVALRDL